MNHLILVGGTGKLVGLAFLRIAEIAALGPGKEFLKIWVLDADDKGEIGEKLRLQALRGKFDEPEKIDPFPKHWARTLSELYAGAGSDRAVEDYFDLLFEKKDHNIIYKEGMFGQPIVGATVLRYALQKKESDSLEDLLNQLQGDSSPRIALAGSNFGGTGSGGVPILAQFLRDFSRGAKINCFIGACILDLLYNLKKPPVSEKNDKNYGPYTDTETLWRNASSMTAFFGEEDLKASLDKLILLGRFGDLPDREYEGPVAQSEIPDALHIIAALQLYYLLFNSDQVGGKDAQGIYSYNVKQETGRTDYIGLEEFQFPFPNQKIKKLFDKIRSISGTAYALQALAQFIVFLPKEKWAAVATKLIPSQLHKLLPTNMADEDRKRVSLNIAKRCLQRVFELVDLLDWLDKCRDDRFLKFKWDDLDYRYSYQKGWEAILEPVPYFKSVFELVSKEDLQIGSKTGLDIDRLVEALEHAIRRKVEIEI
jgi:hypothetical protein